MGKLIFLDIDGTIARPGQAPGQMTVEAIRRARANGHKVFLSTGRMEINVAEDVRAIGFDGGIYGAGGRVVVDGAELVNRPMPPELVRQIIGVLGEENVSFRIETVYGTFPLTDEWAGTPVYKIIFSAVSQEQAERLCRRLDSVAKVVCFVGLVPGLSWIPGEISDPGINKGRALVRICEYLGTDPGECIAFGDSMNDAEILQAAGIGVAMGNSEMCVKEIADQVCESCEEDGIAKALERMHLI